MKYYKINANFDNVAKHHWIRGRFIPDDIYIAGELFTEKEMKKHQEKYLLPAPLDVMATLIEIPKNRTFWFFGARFEVKEN